MANKAQLVGTRQVLDWFTSEGLPYYAIMDSKAIFSSNRNNDDIDEVADKLKRELLAFEQNKNSDVLTIKVFEKPFRDAKKDDGTATRYIRLFDEYVGYLGRVENTQNDRMMQILETINSRLAALETVEEDDEEEEVKQDTGLMGLIDTALKSEEMKGMLINGFMGLANKFIQPKTTALAGIPEEQDAKISQAIELLKQHDNILGDDLLKLASIAVNDNGQFNFLLSMLRK
jgi:gluconate kinase